MRTEPAKIHSVTFTSEAGHTFEPGDPAIAVTQCYRSAELRHGTYVGVRYYPRYSDEGKRPCVVMEIWKSKRKLVHKETGEEYNYKAERALEYPSYVGCYNYHTQNAEYERAVREYNEKRQAYYNAVKEMRKDYEYRKFRYVGRTMLQLNKIFPADIALRDVEL